ncbi:MAG: CtpF protein [Proteobacteria bacterium]|nr:CtpF protein [Pseudomonadota bacterium]
MEKVAGDRRLHHSHVEVFDGDMPAAIARFTQVPTPRLIVIETAMSGDELLHALDALAENCDAGTHVLLVGADNDIIQYRALISRGISDYLLKPLTIGGLIEAAERIFIDPDAPQLGRVFAFFGAEGGVGTSTVAENVAWAIGTVLDEHVTVLDLDLCFGTVAFAYNLEVSQGIEDILASPDRIDEQLYQRYLLHYNERVAILGNRASLGNDANIDPDALAEALNFIRQQTTNVVIDLPHLWSDWVRHVLVEADEAVIIGVQNLAALRDLKSIVEVLNKERGEESKVKVVLNHGGLSKKTEVPAKEFEVAVGVAPVAMVPHDVIVFGQAANNGQMLGDVNRKHKAVESYIALAKALTGRSETRIKARKKGKLSLGLFKKKP